MDSSMSGRISGGHGTFLSLGLIRLGATRGHRSFSSFTWAIQQVLTARP